MNYYAVKALQARAYLWFGDTQKAYEAAQAVITAKDEDGNPRFRLGTAGVLVKAVLPYLVNRCFHFIGLIYKINIPNCSVEMASIKEPRKQR